MRISPEENGSPDTLDRRFDKPPGSASGRQFPSGQTEADKAHQHRSQYARLGYRYVCIGREKLATSVPLAVVDTQRRERDIIDIVERTTPTDTLKESTRLYDASMMLLPAALVRISSI